MEKGRKVKSKGNIATAIKTAFPDLIIRGTHPVMDSNPENRVYLPTWDGEQYSALWIITAKEYERLLNAAGTLQMREAVDKARKATPRKWYECKGSNLCLTAKQADEYREAGYTLTECEAPWRQQ